MKIARELLSRLQVENVDVKDAIAVARAIKEGGGHLVTEIMERKTKNLPKHKVDLIKKTINALVDLSNKDWDLVVKGKWRLGVGFKPVPVHRFDLEKDYLGDELDWDFECTDPTAGEYNHRHPLKITFGQANLETLNCTKFGCFFAPNAFPEDLQLPLLLAEK